MKLLFCENCQDIFKLPTAPNFRECKCGRCGGMYVDDNNAEYWGREAVPIGFANSTLAKAISLRPQRGPGYKFTAFVIEFKCPTMKFLGTIRPEHLMVTPWHKH